MIKREKMKKFIEALQQNPDRLGLLFRVLNTAKELSISKSEILAAIDGQIPPKTLSVAFGIVKRGDTVPATNKIMYSKARELIEQNIAKDLMIQESIVKGIPLSKIMEAKQENKKDKTVEIIKDVAPATLNTGMKKS